MEGDEQRVPTMICGSRVQPPNFHLMSEGGLIDESAGGRLEMG